MRKERSCTRRSWDRTSEESRRTRSARGSRRRQGERLTGTRKTFFRIAWSSLEPADAADGLMAANCGVFLYNALQRTFVRSVFLAAGGGQLKRRRRPPREKGRPR